MTISCIIPAFNEERHIASVLDALVEAGKTLPLEVIVVNDGSSDRTPEILSKYHGFQVITHERNMGKSAAIARGLEVSKGKLILLLDADMVNLTAENIYVLLDPIQKGIADVAMVMLKTPTIFRRMSPVLISGQRVLPRSLIAPCINEIKQLPNFSLEVFLNNLIIGQRCRVKTVYWSNVTSEFKFKKRGLRQGLAADRDMMRDMLQTVSTKELVRQHIALKGLAVKNES